MTEQTSQPSIELHIGDNLDVLQDISQTYANKVDVIYIDPPYNTGKPIFLYHDKRLDWEDFMQQRLDACYPLLSDSGVILVSINDQEHHTLRFMLDKIFGKKNFISTIVWKGNGTSQSKFARGGIDYIVVYAKDKSKASEWKEPKESAQHLLKVAKKAQENNLTPQQAQEALRKFIKQDASLPKGLASYNMVDENYEIYTTSSITNSLYRPNLKFTIINPATGKEYPSPDNGWIFSQETFTKLLNDGRIVFGENRPRKKQFLKENMFQNPYPYIDETRAIGHNELQNIIGKNNFKNPKNTNVLKKWINIVSGYKKDAVIMDFFAGSGTTGQAVAELNHEDGGTRSCVLVTNNENNIATGITIPRLENVLSGNWADRKVHPVLPNVLTIHEDYETIDNA